MEKKIPILKNDSDPFDISILEFNLSLTPEERIENHEAARELMQDLREAGQRHYEAQSQSSP